MLRKPVEATIRCPRLQMSAPLAQQEAEQAGAGEDEMEETWTMSRESVDEWKDEIELLFDRQTPCVHEWVEFGDVTEVAVIFPPEEDVRRETNDGDQGEAELGELIVHHPASSEDTAHGEDEEEGREDASTSSFVEVKEGEALMLMIVFDERSDEIAADDEEDVDADVSAGEDGGETGVVEEDGEDSDGSQSIDFLSIFEHEEQWRNEVALKAYRSICNKKSVLLCSSSREFERMGKVKQY